MSNFKQKFTNFLRGRNFFAGATTAVIIAALIFVNIIIYTLGNYFGWYLYSPKTDDLTLKGNSADVFADAIEEGQKIEIIFCMYDEDLKKHDTGSYVRTTALEFKEKYPNFIDIIHVNIFTKIVEEDGSIFDFSPYEKENRIAASSVIFKCGSNFRVVTDSFTSAGFVDFYTLNASNMVTSYNGEEIFTAMINWVLKDEHKTAYITVGHGETYESALYSSLICAGYNVKEINLRDGEIPSDAGLIVISNPRTDFERAKDLRSEIERLTTYKKNGGCFLVMLDPQSKSLPMLEGFIGDFGIAIAKTESGEKPKVKDSDNAITTDGFTLVAEYSDDAVAKAMYEKTKELGGKVIIRDVAALTLSGSAKPILVSSSSSVTEAGGNTVSSDGRYTIAAYSSLKNSDGAEDARLFVVPSVYLAAADAMITNGYSNKDFLYSLFDVFYRAGNMPYGSGSVVYNDGILENLTMSTARLYTLIMVAIPAAVAVLGAVILIRRKNR